jgi:hypothetical protein
VEITYLLAATARSYGDHPAVSFGTKQVWDYAG